MSASGFLIGDPRGIQTPNLLIRSQLLYSVELWGLYGVQRYKIFQKKLYLCKFDCRK